MNERVFHIFGARALDVHPKGIGGERRGKLGQSESSPPSVEACGQHCHFSCRARRGKARRCEAQLLVYTPTDIIYLSTLICLADWLRISSIQT